MEMIVFETIDFPGAKLRKNQEMAPISLEDNQHPETGLIKI